MKALTVNPEHLRDLAAKQDDAAEKFQSGAAAADGIAWDAWWTHGVISAISNVAVTKLEAARRTAGEALKNASGGLAENLRNAKEIYVNADEKLSENLDRQVLDR